MSQPEPALTEEQHHIFLDRYSVKGANGHPIETPRGVISRVAIHAATTRGSFDEEAAALYADMITRWEFIPDPSIMAGLGGDARGVGQRSLNDGLFDLFGCRAMGTVNLLKFVGDDLSFDWDRFSVVAVKSALFLQNVAASSGDDRPIGLAYSALHQVQELLGFHYGSHEAQRFEAIMKSTLSHCVTITVMARSL